jgi:Zn-dependent oligopeptidase
MTNGSPHFTEIFSMFSENLGNRPERLRIFAKNATGEIIPDHILEALDKSGSYFSECDLLRLIQNCRRDLAYHSTAPQDYINTAGIHAASDFNSPYAAHIRSYPLTRFTHLSSELFLKGSSGDPVGKF